MIKIQQRNTIGSLIEFTPALTNLWEFEFEEGADSGLDAGAREVLQNLKYLISSIEIEGWSFKYDFIPAFQQNVIVGLTRPTKITMTLTDTKNLGVLDSLINLIKNRIFYQPTSTVIPGISGKNLGKFTIKIINPYYQGDNKKYYPLSDTATPDKFVSFIVVCDRIHLGTTPPIILTRAEAKPLSYVFEFYCDFIDYVSNEIEPSPEKKTIKQLDIDMIREPEIRPKLEDTKNAGVPAPGINISKTFEKFLKITTPVFSNLFHVDFEFGKENSILRKLNASVRSGEPNLFNDVIIESVTIDGYKMDYFFSESTIQNLLLKVHRPLNISFTVIDNSNLSFLSALYIIIKNYYYRSQAGCYVRYPDGKNMSATFVLYDTLASGIPDLQYLIYSEGMKIARMPSLSLNYTNSEVIKYSVDMVCDNITYFNKNEVQGNKILSNKVV